jgi:hypothetical protein
MEAAICWVCAGTTASYHQWACLACVMASKSWNADSVIVIASRDTPRHPRKLHSNAHIHAHTRHMERVVVAVNDDNDTDMDMDVIHASPCWRTTMPSSFTNENNANEQLPLSFSTLHISSSLLSPPPPPQQHYQQPSQQQPPPPDHALVYFAPPPPPPHNRTTRNDLLASLLAFKDSIGPPEPPCTASSPP